MRALTTKKEREIVMEQLRPVSKREKILFPIAVTIIVSFLLPSAAPLVGALMLGNLFRESGVVDRICKTAQNELMNIVTIFLGLTVGATATTDTFLRTFGLESLAQLPPLHDDELPLEQLAATGELPENTQPPTEGADG